MATDNWAIEEEDPGAWKEAVSYAVSILLAMILCLTVLISYALFMNKLNISA